jgi:hypothetical protein
MGNLVEIRTMKRVPNVVTVDISDEACKPFGFVHGEIAIDPNNNEVKIIGVGLGNNGKEVLWYTIIHPSIKNDEACYWGGEKNLLEAGFKKKTA